MFPKRNGSSSRLCLTTPPQSHHVEIAHSGNGLDVREHLRTRAAYKESTRLGKRKAVEGDRSSGSRPQIRDESRLHHRQRFAGSAVKELYEAHNVWQTKFRGTVPEVCDHLDCHEKSIVHVQG